MSKLLIFLIIALQIALSTQDETCNVTTYPLDYFRILPAMVPFNFTETYQIIEISNETGAKCLDGTNYKFFFTPGVGEGVSKFMFFFEGAGFCGADGSDFLTSCLSRISTQFGTSADWGDNGTNTTYNQAMGYFQAMSHLTPNFGIGTKLS